MKRVLSFLLVFVFLLANMPNISVYAAEKVTYNVSLVLMPEDSPTSDNNVTLYLGSVEKFNNNPVSSIGPTSPSNVTSLTKVTFSYPVINWHTVTTTPMTFTVSDFFTSNNAKYYLDNQGWDEIPKDTILENINQSDIYIYLHPTYIYIDYYNENGKLISGLGDARKTTLADISFFLCPTPEKKGYTFKGWSCRNEGVTNSSKIYDQYDDYLTDIYFDNPNIKKPQLLKLYPNYEANTYTIYYDPTNDGELAETTQTFKCDESITLKTPTPKDPNMQFTGWVYKDGTKKGQSFSTRGADYDARLIAQYSPKTYNITYTKPKGEYNNPNPTTYTYKTGLVLKDASKEGYRFNGWKDDKGNSITAISETIGGDITLTPEFVPNEYKITYKNIPSGVTNSNPATYTYGTTTKLMNLEQKGYTFKGWKDSKGNKLSELNSQTLGDIELQPEFEANTYKITYKDVPSGVSNSNPATYTYGTAVTLKDISQSGYKFDGWYDSNNKLVTNISNTTVGDIELTAKFTKIEDKKTNTSENATTTEDKKPNNTTEDKKANTTETLNTTTTEQKPNTTTKYSIKYNKIPKGATNPNPSYYVYGKGVTLKSIKYKGYTFLGWYTASGKKITTISKTAKGNAVLTAKWSKNVTAPAITGKKVTKKKTYVLVKYNKATNVAGYQIRYTLNKKTKTVNTTTTSKKLNKKAKNIKVRSIVKSNGKYIYSIWS